ncbi:unnamed protein product [Adineta ricciae]|uniref:Uncharacterized protein n=1 Tax=Adineta ricciae TaxID=249248 RepID=A0A813XMX8_ADIRI|nr:unnamed protein product [Adineta ricciae]CAF1537875.1 unnamed protein product [Adineta ricciae]
MATGFKDSSTSNANSITIPTCSFTYVSTRTHQPRRVTGVERTWEYLKERFNRASEGLPDLSTRYFETTGFGPFLFAVADDAVFYHDEEKWTQYKSASDIEYGTMTIDL